METVYFLPLDGMALRRSTSVNLTTFEEEDDVGEDEVDDGELLLTRDILEPNNSFSTHIFLYNL